MERAERFGRMRELDFQHPQSARWRCFQFAEVAAFVDRVREIADPVPLDRVIELPAHRRGAFACQRVQRLAAQPLYSPRVSHFAEQRARRFRAGPPLRRVADHESVAHIALVAVEDQAEVDEVAVVLAQPHAGLGALPVGFHGVRADADDRRVPQPLDTQLAKYVGGFDFRLVLADAWVHARADAVQRGPALLASTLHQGWVVALADGFAQKGGHGW